MMDGIDRHEADQEYDRWLQEVEEQFHRDTKPTAADSHEDAWTAALLCATYVNEHPGFSRVLAWLAGDDVDSFAAEVEKGNVPW